MPSLDLGVDIMVEILAVEYTHAVGDSIAFRTKSYSIKYMEPGKSVEHAPGQVRKVVDPDMPYRVLMATATIVTAEYEKIEDWVFDGTVYDGTYPNVRWQVDGATPKTMLCMSKEPMKRHKSDNKWIVTLTFIERSAP